MAKIKKEEIEINKYLCRKCSKGLLAEHEKCGFCNTIMHSEKGAFNVSIDKPTKSKKQVIRRTKVHGRTASKGP
jgi:ribosomal protein S27AE